MDAALHSAIAQLHRECLPAGVPIFDLAAALVDLAPPGVALPFPDAAFDGATLDGGIDTLRDPIAILRETARVLRPGAPLVVTFTDRSPSPLARPVWRALDDGDARCGVVATTFRAAGAEYWSRVEVRDLTAAAGTPLYAVISRRQPATS